MKKVLFPGSFDPVSLGHLDVIRRASALFDQVHVINFCNPAKQYLFSQQERLELLKTACAAYPNVLVGCDNGYVADYAKKNGICAIVKGARSGADFDYEKKQADYNLEHGGVPTLLLCAEADHADVSSTEIRRRLAQGEKIDDIIHPSILEKILSFYALKAK